MKLIRAQFSTITLLKEKKENRRERETKEEKDDEPDDEFTCER